MLVISVKGGAGKTTSAVHIAAAKDDKTLLIDAEIQNHSALKWVTGKSTAPGSRPNGSVQIHSSLLEHCVRDTPR